MPRRKNSDARTPKLDGVSYGQRTVTNKHPNQWTANPKQELWLKLYLTPGSPSFGNAYESAITVGYSESYAHVIASPAVSNDWIKNSLQLASLKPDHIIQGIQQEAMMAPRSGDRLRAYELLAKMQGMLIDRSMNMNVNIEAAIQDLK